MPYTGRLAPSPTGFLHLGHAATFLTAHERAHAAGGRLLMRMDDLDPQRRKDSYAAAAREDLHWLGLGWEAEVRQSERLELYRAAMEQLLRQGDVYACTCTRKDLQGATQAPHEDSNDEPLYNGRCRPEVLPKQGAAADGNRLPGLPAAPLRIAINYRFRVNDNESVHFCDGHCGPQSFVAGVDFGDFLVWRKDGLPSYQLACVVDDADMGITEVVRGRDLLKSTARQILLGRALGLAEPRYFHTELLRDEHGLRFAKRHDALSLRALREAGVSPEGIRARVEGLLHQRDT